MGLHSVMVRCSMWSRPGFVINTYVVVDYPPHPWCIVQYYDDDACDHKACAACVLVWRQSNVYIPVYIPCDHIITKIILYYASGLGRIMARNPSALRTSYTNAEIRLRVISDLQEAYEYSWATLSMKEARLEFKFGQLWLNWEESRNLVIVNSWWI